MILKQWNNFGVPLGIFSFLGIIQFLIRNSSDQKMLILGIFFLYLSSLLFVYSFQSILKEKDMGLFFFLGILFPYYFQKHPYVFKDLMRESHNIRNINYVYIFIFSIFFLKYFFYNTEKNWKEYLEVENIRNYLLYLMPFFILRAKDIKMIGFFYGIVVFVFCYKKDWNILLEKRKKICLLFLVLLFLFFSYMSNYVWGIPNQFGEQLLGNYVYNYFLLLILLLIPISEEMMKKIKMSTAISLFYPILLIVLEWIQNHYTLEIAMGTEEWTSIWAVRAGLVSLISLFFYLSEKRKVYLFGVIFSLLSLFLGQGRGPILSFIASFCILFFFFYEKKTDRKKVFTSLGIVLLLLFVIYNTENYIIKKFQLVFLGADSSTNTRIELYHGAIEQWKSQKWTGYGLGSYKETVELLKQEYLEKYDLSRIPHAHNNILELLRSLGILGTFIYIFLNGYLCFWLLGKYWKTREKLYILPFILIVNFELSGITDFSLMMYKSQLLLFFICSLSLSYTISMSTDVEKI
ncbi:hypothetical protein FUSO6_06270 [Fusobacterium necrophorum DAB]|uniref:O-antigen ligase family protein n=1 Tax=Fusobacterium necrophorum TaxID=859 RepID=UPI000461ED4E|nr:O-antigen ligase family protein [Fusobacterium necrophorum]KDE69613.1 hypothetical protein FUSO6_06270 [Fusobacterium necrophorum DAB]